MQSVSPIFNFLAALLLGAALNVAAFFFMVTRYVEVVPVMVDTCKQQPRQSAPPTLRMT